MPRNYSQWSACKAVFHTRSGDVTVLSDRGGARDVVQAVISKSISQPCGGFQMTLVPRIDYLSLLKPNDWVDIYLDDGTGRFMGEPYMLGILDHVEQSDSVGGRGAPQSLIHIVGRDYGKVLLSTELMLDPALATMINKPGFLAVLYDTFDASKVPLRSPSETVKALVAAYHDKRSCQMLPPASSKRPLALDVSRVEETRGALAVDTNPNIAGGLWGILSQYMNPVLNEMFVDTIEGGPALVMREHPFSHDAFAALANAAVSFDEITSTNFGKSDGDVRNWFRVYPEGSSLHTVETSAMFMVGYINRKSIKEAGIRRMEVPTNAFGDLHLIDIYNGEVVGGLLQEWSGVIAEWNHANDQLLSGTAQLRLRPDIRIGMRVDLRRRSAPKDLSFYVEGVTHNFMFPGASRTSLSLTRGVERKMGSTLEFGRPKAAVQFPLLKNLAYLLNTGALDEIAASDEFGEQASAPVLL